MKNIWLIIKTNIKRKPLALVFSILSGVFLCLSLFLLGNYVSSETLSNIELGVIDYDNSYLSESFKTYLTEDLEYRLIENEDYDRLSEMLIDKDISVIIEIPSGLYKSFAMGREEKLIVTATDDFENAAFLEAYINSYFAAINMLSVSADGDKDVFDSYLSQFDYNDIPIERIVAFDFDLQEFKEVEGFRNAVGFFLMIVFALGNVLSFMIIDDRSSKIFSRITVTPVKPYQYIAGNSIYGFFLLMIEVIIYCGYIEIMNIHIGFPVYILFFLMILLSMFVILFTIIISILFDTKSGTLSCIMGFCTVGALLGGAYFPIDLAPQNLQNLARILPQFWFMDAIRKLIDNPIANITSNIIILMLFIVLLFLIGAVVFSQNYKKG